MAKSKATSLVLTPTVLEFIEDRYDGYSAGINDTVDTMRQLIAHEKRYLNLSREEALLICDAMNGTILDRVAITELAADIEDVIIYEQLDKKWNIGAADLITKLNAMNNLQKLAIIDGVRVFWRTKPPKEDDKFELQLRKAGFLRIDAGG
ncbi:MAG: hypothetical protein ACOCZW_01325 [Bacteroidota bacterium]